MMSFFIRAKVTVEIAMKRTCRSCGKKVEIGYRVLEQLNSREDKHICGKCYFKFVNKKSQRILKLGKKEGWKVA